MEHLAAMNGELFIFGFDLSIHNSYIGCGPRFLKTLMEGTKTEYDIRESTHIHIYLSIY